jgi:hypothetical protein
MALLVGLLAPAGPARSREGSPRLATPQLLDRAVARGRLNRSTADLYLAYAFGAPKRLPEAYASPVPWDGTLPLLHLQQRVAGMRRGPTRARIEDILGLSVPGTCGGQSGGATITSTTHFYVESGTILGGLSISDYTTSLESTWTREVTTFGWASPPLLASNPPNGRYPVVIANLGTSLYGFVSTTGTYAAPVGNNPNTTWNDVDAQATCMALNRNYDPFPGTSQQALDATTAHEFNHSIQFGYGALTGANQPDVVFVEGGATWMEDEVFDGSNDNYNYLWPSFTISMGQYTPSPYPYWVVFRALTERFGTGTSGGGEQVMQDFWEAVSQSATAVDLNALNTGLANKGTTLADAYHAAAVALKFNVACTGGVVYPYCLEEGPSYVAAKGANAVHASIASVGGNVSRTLQDNYALNWIGLPVTGTYSVTLQNNSAAGGQLRGTVACLTGSGMSVTAFPSVVGPASSTALPSFDPASCTGTPVAVITNQAQTAADPPSSTARSYTLSTATAGTTFPLTVSISGSGSVSSSVPGIVCPGDCAQSYESGTAVMLDAVANPGWQFDSWSGDCSGSGTCTVSMDAAKSVTATFTPLPQHLLQVTTAGTGSGTVTSAPAGISCPVDCSQSYPSDTSAVLTAMPGGGSAFSGWSGDCTGSGTCTVVMSADRSVTATFIGQKSVTLSARPKKVERGERTRLKATVKPCAGHEGDLIEFYRGATKIATKPSDAACTARLKVRMKKTARFQAVSPQQDADHLAGTSNKVKVRVLPA